VTLVNDGFTPEAALGTVVERMSEAVSILFKNLPEHSDSLAEKSKKYHIVERQLVAIKDALKEGRAAREAGSIEVSTALLEPVNATLDQFSRDKDTTITIKHDGEEVTTTPAQLSKALDVLKSEREGC